MFLLSKVAHSVTCACITVGPRCLSRLETLLSFVLKSQIQPKHYFSIFTAHEKMPTSHINLLFFCNSGATG